MELSWVIRGVALEPRVPRGRLGDPQTLEQGRARALVEHRRADLLQSDPRDEVVRPFLVLGVLAVELQKGGRCAERFGARLDGTEHVALADGAPRGAADPNLPSALERDHADVLDRRLGAVAWTSRHAGLDLVGGVQPFPRLLHLDSQRDRVAEPVAAEVGSDAGLDRPHRLRVRESRGHAEVAPDRRQILLAHAEQVDPLATRDLDHRHLVLVGRVGDPAQLIGGHDAAVNPRHDREGAVPLDVGVDAIVDEPCVTLFKVAVFVDLGDQVCQRRLAGTAFAAGPASVRHVAHRRPAVLADRPCELLPRLSLARAQVRGFVPQAACGGGDDRGHGRPAGTAAGSGPRARHHLAWRGTPALAHGGYQLAFADAVAVADLGAVGQVLRPQRSGRRQPAKWVGHGLSRRDLGQ